jgi:hypothetical protein
MESSFPWNSPYVSMSNNPINRIDPTGKGDYYSKDGKNIGSDNKTKKVGKGENEKEIADDKAYLASQETIDKYTTIDKKTNKSVTDWDKVIADKSVIDITTKYGYTNSQLLQGAAMAYNEGENTFEGRNAIVNVLINRQEKWKMSFEKVMSGLAGSSVGSTHDGRMKSSWFSRYASFFNAGTDGRNKSIVYKNCISASIAAITNGKDYSNGAIYWHGVDFFSNVCQKNGKDWQAYKNEYLPKGFKWAEDAIKNNTPPSYFYEIKGSKNNDYFYLGEAYYGKNTFMSTKTGKL